MSLKNNNEDADLHWAMSVLKSWQGCRMYPRSNEMRKRAFANQMILMRKYLEQWFYLEKDLCAAIEIQDQLNEIPIYLTEAQTAIYNHARTIYYAKY